MLELKEIMPDKKRDVLDDVDDFMANLFGNTPPPPSKPVKQRVHRPKGAAPNEAKKTGDNDTHPVKNASKGPRKGLRAILLMPLVVLAVFFAVWMLKDPVSSIFSPASPFTDAQKDRMGVPLYFPVKLPGSFKIETDAMANQAQDGVFMYVISDDNGKFLTINQQPRPAGADLTEMFSELSDVRDIKTPFGTAKAGLDQEAGNKTITYMTTDKTWFIATMDQDTMTDDELSLLLGSLKEG